MTVRRLEPGDWELLRDLRLTALAETPMAFGATLEEEAAFTEDDWRGRLGNAGAASLVAEREDEDGVGLVTGVGDATDRTLVHLYGLWVAPEARGTGTADMLVAALIDWCRALGGVEVIRLHVTEGNERAERFYERHGFRRTGGSFVRDRDGLAEKEMELRVGADR